MKNLDIDNTNNLDESFSNSWGDFKEKYLAKNVVKAGLFGGPLAAQAQANKNAKKAKADLEKANASEKAQKQQELDDANNALEEANSKLASTQSQSGGNASGNKEGMSPALKWSLISLGGILLIGGIITAVVLIRKK